MITIPASYDIISELPLTKHIERAGRLAYKSEDKITPVSAEPFVSGIIKRGHWPVLDMGIIHLELILPDLELIEFLKIQKWSEGKYIFFDVLEKVATSKSRCVLTGSPRALTEFFNSRFQGRLVRQITSYYYTKNPICFSGLRSKVFPGIRSVDICVLSDIANSKDKSLRESITDDNIYMKHKNVSVRFTINRATSHEIVRHRPCGFLQECLSGDTIVSAYRGGKHVGKSWTMKQLYDYSTDQRKGRLKLIRLRGVTNDGSIIPVKIKNVIKTGINKVFDLVTSNGRKIRTTDTHKFLTNNGWKTLKELSVGMTVLCNGIEALKNREFLRKKYIVDNIPRKELATFLGVADSTLGKILAKLGLQKPKTQYPNRQPGHGVQGMHSKKEKINISMRMTGENNHRYKGDAVKNGRSRAQQLYNVSNMICECGKPVTDRHHIDRDIYNNDINNIEFLCDICHRARHSVSVMTVFSDKIISITPVGEEMTYDLEIDHPCHNFIANGIVVHNSQRYCRYSNDKFGNQVTFIKPTAFNFTETELSTWTTAMNFAEKEYLFLLDNHKVSPQAARLVLPNSCKTEIIVHCNLLQWTHILRLRTSKAADPSMREVMIPLSKDLCKLFPMIDIITPPYIAVFAY